MTSHESGHRTAIASELRANAIGLPTVVMQGVATIAPALSIVLVFQFSVSLAGIVAPLSFLFAFFVVLMVIGSVTQLAKVFPSAGGWYTWIARTLDPRAGFIAGWLWSLWLPVVAVTTTSYLAQTVLQPSINQEYGVNIPWWVFVLVVVGIVAVVSYLGIVISGRVLIITGIIELGIILALAIAGLASPGKGGFSFQPFNPSNLGHAPDLWLAFVFSIFAFGGWEAVAPLAEETTHPRRNVKLGLVLSASIWAFFLLFVTWGLLIGAGTANVQGIASAPAFPGFTLAVRVWGSAWVILLFALINSSIAASIGCFTGTTRVWYAMGRSGTLPAVFGKVNPTRKTPDNAIHLTLAACALAFVLAIGYGPVPVFVTWSLAITFGEILLYILANLGVMKYYIRERRSEFNPIFHLVFPIVSSVAVAYVAYKSVVPLPPPPARYAPIVFGAWVALGICILVYLRVSKREAFLERAQEAMASAVDEPRVASMVPSEEVIL
jgi:amino acid transporter